MMGFEEELKKLMQKIEQEIEKADSGEWKSEFMIDAKKTNLDFDCQLRLSYVTGMKQGVEDAVAVYRLQQKKEIRNFLNEIANLKEITIPKEKLEELLKNRPRFLIGSKGVRLRDALRKLEECEKTFRKLEGLLKKGDKENAC